VLHPRCRDLDLANRWCSMDKCSIVLASTTCCEGHHCCWTYGLRY
jgi:hypothetical protein